jgi:hypothetical protein
LYRKLSIPLEQIHELAVEFVALEVLATPYKAALPTIGRQSKS